MKTRIFFSICLTICSQFLFAQSAKENLEQGVQIYNALKEYCQELTDKTITDQNIKEIEARQDKALALFKKVVADGTADEIKAARYFRTLTRYQYAYSLGMKTRNKESLAILTEIENDLNSYTEASFPIRYAFFEKKFVIEFKNFASTQSEFYGVMGELLMMAGKTNEALVYLQKSIKSLYTTNFIKFVSYNKLLNNKKKNNQYDKEMIDYALGMMEQYDLTSEDTKKIIRDYAYESYPTAAKYFNEALAKLPPSVDKGLICSKAATFITKYMDEAKEPSAEKRTQNGNNAKLWFRKAIEEGRDDSQILADALKVAKTVDNNKSEFGLFVVDKMANKLTASNCEGARRIATEYTFFGNSSKANEMMKKADECQKKQEVEAKRIAEERRKEQDRLEKERKRLSRESHFYVGLNIVPLIFKDYGAVVNFGAKNTLFEVSYLKVTKKKENFFDLSLRDIEDVQEHKWDGFFVHLAYKGANGRTSTRKQKNYAGFLLGYNQRTFEPFTSQVTNTNDSRVSNKTFSPSTKQYLLMLNFGMMYLKKMGIDMFYGIGATYNQFDGGNSEVYNKTNYKIDDKMVGNRKPSYFGFSMRMGFSVGIGW